MVKFLNYFYSSLFTLFSASFVLTFFVLFALYGNAILLFFQKLRKVLGAAFVGPWFDNVFRRIRIGGA